MSLKQVKTNFNANFVDNFDFFLFDADGVLWLGDKALPGAVDFLELLIKKGKNIFIMSNNSTKTIKENINKLHKLGFLMVLEDHVISPAKVLAHILSKTPSDLPVYLIGSEGLQKELLNKGIKSFGVGPDMVEKYTDDNFIYDIDTSQPVRAVVVSYDIHINYVKIMKAVNFIHHHKVDFIATNEDSTLPGPIKDVTLPGAGVNVKAVEKASGKQPIVIGKPYIPMFQYISEKYSVDANRSVMFGDRCDTDIKFGRNAGTKTVLVGTGVHNLEDVRKILSQNLLDQVPDYFCASLDSLSKSLV